MKHLKYVYIFVVLFLFACKSNHKEAYFKEANGFFEVNNFANPIQAVDTFETGIGKIVLHSFMIEESDKVAKTITYSDYPQNVVNLKTPYEVLDIAKQGAVKSIGLNKFLKHEKIEMNKIPGYEIIGTNELGFYVHYKLFLKGNRLFQIGILKDGSKNETKEEKDFIESFVVL